MSFLFVYSSVFFHLFGGFILHEKTKKIKRKLKKGLNKPCGFYKCLMQRMVCYTAVHCKYQFVKDWHLIKTTLFLLWYIERSRE